MKLSKASKMPCPSWSLPAWDTCPGAKGATGNPVEACTRCYALQGRYLFANVKNAREHNKRDWLRDGWASDMVVAIRNLRFFRWFDSGDIYNVELGRKILEVVSRTPHTKHWIPTRSYKDAGIRPILDAINKLPNAVVRFSSDTIDGGIPAEFEYSSVIVSEFHNPGVPNVVPCTAFKRAGKCGPCRACWSKNVRSVLYPLHGGKAPAKAFEVSQ